jgi:hypothetical protein
VAKLERKLEGSEEDGEPVNDDMVVVLWMDNSLYFAEDEEGSWVLPKRGDDGKYHIEGQVKLASGKQATKGHKGTREVSASPQAHEKEQEGDTRPVTEKHLPAMLPREDPLHQPGRGRIPVGYPRWYQGYTESVAGCLPRVASHKLQGSKWMYPPWAAWEQRI